MADRGNEPTPADETKHIRFVSMEPHNATSDLQPHFGFGEIDIGPKYTFLRSESTGTLGAAGLNFNIPAGERRVAQDTGSLTLEPYVSFGQSFFRTSYGTFQALSTFGYNFSVDRQRSDNFFSSWHLDYDFGNFHKIYPLIELTWFHDTRNGKSRDLDFEGADLFNFGSRHAAGHNDLTMALGARYKYNEYIQFGGAFEFLLTGHRDMEDFRLLLDVIFRY